MMLNKIAAVVTIETCNYIHEFYELRPESVFWSVDKQSVKRICEELSNLVDFV